MAVTPITAPYRVAIFYRTPTLYHKLELFCDGGLNSGTGTYEVKDKPTGSFISTASAVAAFVALLKVTYKSTATFDSWTLFENSGGAMIPRNQGSLGVNGLSSAAESPWGQYTLFFRDSSYKPLKVVLLGSADVSVNRFAYSVLGTSLKDIVDDLLNLTTGHAGNWVTSRGFNSPASFLAITGTANRKSRRRLNIE